MLASMTQRGASAERFEPVVEGFVEGRARSGHGISIARRSFVELLRETVKVAKFELPPDALPEASLEGPEMKVAAPEWERKVAAALWVIAAAIVATLWLTRA